MQVLDFWLDDISAAQNYISLQAPITFGAITPRVTTVQVVGKSGDLHIDHDAYDNIPGVAKCYALAENVSAAMADINAFLFAQKGYRRLKTSDDVLYYREARIANGGEIAARLALLNPFTINFDCKPFRRLISGDDAIFVQSGDVITNPTGFTAEPLIYFSAIDSGTIQIGNYTVTVNSGIPDYAVMDCELWTCYPESGAAGYGYNSYISAARYPMLNVGNNTISWTGGVTVSKIVPRWRSL